MVSNIYRIFAVVAIEDWALNRWTTGPSRLSRSTCPRDQDIPEYSDRLYKAGRRYPTGFV